MKQQEPQDPKRVTFEPTEPLKPGELLVEAAAGVAGLSAGRVTQLARAGVIEYRLLKVAGTRQVYAIDVESLLKYKRERKLGRAKGEEKQQESDTPGRMSFANAQR